MIKRYQECNWYQKLWRKRHYFRIPFLAFYYWIYSNLVEDRRFRLYFNEAWSIATGMVHGDMHWYYTLEEVKEMFSDSNEE